MDQIEDDENTGIRRDLRISFGDLLGDRSHSGSR